MLPTVMAIAGFDPSGGAGIAADLKTIAALRCYGVGVVTAVTVQDTKAVRSVHPLPPDLVARQAEVVAADVEVRAVKVGMLATAALVERVALLAEAGLLPNLVLDPVLRSHAGDELLERDGIETLCLRLLPRATVLTPNLDEASRLCGRAVRDVAGMKEAARELHRLGARQVVIKGGHLPGRPVDVVFNGEEFALFDSTRLPSAAAHGLGCTFSAAVACGIARGFPLFQAVADAKRYVSRALAGALRLGKGSAVLDHGAA